MPDTPTAAAWAAWTCSAAKRLLRNEQKAPPAETAGGAFLRDFARAADLALPFTLQAEVSVFPAPNTEN
jgi:hypothetical protein